VSSALGRAEEFSMHHLAERYVEIYEGVLGRR
jgi:hypothetical protein